LGGERKENKGLFSVGCSFYAQFIGKSSYLEPNSGSLQKPVEGLFTALLLGLYIVSIYKRAIVFSEH